MMPRLIRLAQGLGYRRMMRRLRRDMQLAQTAEGAELRDLRGRTRNLRREVEALWQVLDARGGASLSAAAAVPMPAHADWGWRPEPWRMALRPAGLAAPESKARLGSDLTLFHDCTTAELTLRQLRNTRPDDLAPWALALDVLGFDGTFLSLALALPQDGLRGLLRRHVLTLSCEIEAERPVQIFARLNIRSGPNTEQVVREIPAGTTLAKAEFDLGYADFNESRVDRGWLDIIIDAPAMNRVVLRDLTLTRRQRATL